VVNVLLLLNRQLDGIQNSINIQSPKIVGKVQKLSVNSHKYWLFPITKLYIFGRLFNMLRRELKIDEL